MKSYRKLIFFVLLVLLTLRGTSVGADSQPFTPHRDAEVMTYNVYLGADISPILAAPNELDLILAVTEAFAQVQASDVPLRMSHIANAISESAPDLIGLEEVDLLSINGSVQFDYLQLILEALGEQGAHYAAVVVQDNLDASAPMFDQNFNIVTLRLVDRDVLLVRTDLPAGELKISNARAQTFENLLTIPSPVLGSFTIPRGWISADVKAHGKTIRFITGHLEAFDPDTNEMQGLELLSGPADTSMPVVMAADFNSGPDAPFGFTGTYSNITGAGFEDAWTVVNSSLTGETCCQFPDLSNSSSNLFERIDQVFFTGGIGAASIQRVGDDPINSVPPFWASDHDGLLATLQIPTR